MNTWLEDFHTRTDLNKYPVSLRTRGGIGYRLPSGETVSNFVGHPVHYLDNGIWKPITLEPKSNGDFEGSDFAWRGKQVFYKGKTLFEPRAVRLDGVEYKLFLRKDGNRIVADLPFGQYEIAFREGGVKETLTIPEPVDGLLEFDIPHAQKPHGLFKQDRHIVGGITAEKFQLTKDMTFPLVIDPDYAANTSDGYISGGNASYATTRSTSTGHSDAANTHYLHHDTGYTIRRSYVKFDTAGIPDGDTVSSAVMNLYVLFKSTTVNWDVLIVKQDWSAQDPLSAGNRGAAYNNTLTDTLDDNIWQNTSAVSINTAYNSGALSASWVSKTAATYYSLINANDRNNTTPTTDQELRLASQDHATSGFRPYLTVTHAASSNGSFWFM